MEFKIYDFLPEEAVYIRTEVFVKEQGFRHEFDETDKTAKHIVAFSEGKAVGVCRFFLKDNAGAYAVGRLAVLKAYRSEHIGSALLAEAERCVRGLGGTSIFLHAQVRVKEFYGKHGYQVCSAADSEDTCPHIWMRKNL